ncbi:zinc-binding dehydrogenase [Leifsonia shinshuensis]|uniref:zinc-binding dehydrogenase n=1 Tax=Leifsonia shinshuensis TaxID=150026 RepID=UPI001F513A4E|nr:zinc-binding dehydrogenase [Leifsonia shinshuensis]MCI0159291.1 zinc-binding dehydrogenase [Leifsonia shinshuensis]
MRAIVQDEFGDPARVLKVEERPLPEPGVKQVRVRTVLSPIHNHDLWTIRGTYGFKPALPAATGTEAVGIVDAVGEGVEGLAVGQRVVTGGTFGVWAEAFIAPAGALIPVPDGLSDEVASQLVAMPFSALSLLDFLEVKPGEVVLQNAANGAVGRLLAQFALERGEKVIGLVRRRRDADALAAQGIPNLVATSDDDWRDRVRALADGAPIAVAVDSVGGESSGDLLSLLAENGTLVSFGAMGSDGMQMSSGDLIFKQATVKGFWGSKVSAAMAPAKRGELFGELIRAASTGAITLPVEAVFGFDRVREAVEVAARSGRTGKVLLRP